MGFHKNAGCARIADIKDQVHIHTARPIRLYDIYFAIFAYILDYRKINEITCQVLEQSFIIRPARAMAFFPAGKNFPQPFLNPWQIHEPGIVAKTPGQPEMRMSINIIMGQGGIILVSTFFHLHIKHNNKP